MPQKRVGVYLDATTYEKLKVILTKKNISVSRWMREVIEKKVGKDLKTNLKYVLE